MEEGKGLLERVADIEYKLSPKVEDSSDSKKKKLYPMLALIGVGFVIGFLAWLFLGITFGIIIGLVAGAVAWYFVSKQFATIWNLPFMVRRIGKKKKREGYVILQHLGINKAAWFEKVQINEGVAMGKDLIPHKVDADDIFIWKNKIPMIIVPDYSKYPIRAGELYAETIKNKSAGSMGWQFLMNYIYKTQIKEKKKMATGIMIIGAIAVIGLGWYLIKSGAFK